MIKHILSDGTVRESMLGYKVPICDATKIAYETLADRVINRQHKEEKKKCINASLTDLSMLA